MDTKEQPDGHTKGRWMAAAKPSYLGWPIVSSPSGRMICDVAIAPKPDGETDGAWSAHYVEVEANARLIAAQAAALSSQASVMEEMAAELAERRKNDDRPRR